MFNYILFLAHKIFLLFQIFVWLWIKNFKEKHKSNVLKIDILTISISIDDNFGFCFCSSSLSYSSNSKQYWNSVDRQENNYWKCKIRFFNFLKNWHYTKCVPYTYSYWWRCSSVLRYYLFGKCITFLSKTQPNRKTKFVKMDGVCVPFVFEWIAYSVFYNSIDEFVDVWINRKACCQCDFFETERSFEPGLKRSWSRRAVSSILSIKI